MCMVGSVRMCILENWQRDCCHTGNCQFLCGIGWHQSKRKSFKKWIQNGFKSNKTEDVKTRKYRQTPAGEADRLLVHLSDGGREEAAQGKRLKPAAPAPESCSGGRSSTWMAGREPCT